MKHVRNRFFVISDILLLPLAALLAFIIRFEGVHWSTESQTALTAFILYGLPVKVAILYGLGMYRRLWRYASVSDLELIARACALSAVVVTFLGAIVLPRLGLVPQRVPLSVLVIDAGLTGLFVGLPRFLVRLGARRLRAKDARPALIVGAGAAGGLIVRELQDNAQLGIRPVGFIDDDRGKQGLRLHDVPVLGTLDDLSRVAAREGVTDVIIAIPSAPGKTVRAVVRQASESGLKTRTVPGVYELLSGEKSVSALRNIEIHDLLRREPITTDVAQVRALVTGHPVLITGAGGSIGRELCRQLARLEPSKIVAVGRGENSIFDLLQELKKDFPRLEIEPVIADVREERRMQRVFAHYKPYSVFHAAAHKHVPLMEANVAEAILNNVMGTSNVVHCATMCEAEHFVLVSTDKAVRPTSVMGATKRIAEYIVHEVALEHPQYVAVRFGNVLGSRGSVVPTFMRQIAEGGPVTITHPEMTRYFMTIPEAVQLVLQAAAMGERGEVFVLDMGEPVRVLDLAMDMIRLSGLDVGDIELQFSGMRPGEKLYEELFFSSADAEPTSHQKILRAKDQSFPSDGHALIEQLVAAASSNARDSDLRRMIAGLVPEYVGAIDTSEYPLPIETEESDAVVASV
jgi:FlaA1/EpsC-like NDP-sugar epimerase